MTDLNWLRVTKRFLPYHRYNWYCWEARTSYIIRDFEKKAEARKAAIPAIADKMNQELGSDRVTWLWKTKTTTWKKLSKGYDSITIAKKQSWKVLILPIIEPIRGGTDGSPKDFLHGNSYSNIFAGGGYARTFWIRRLHGRCSWYDHWVYLTKTKKICKATSFSWLLSHCFRRRTSRWIAWFSLVCPYLFASFRTYLHSA